MHLDGDGVGAGPQVRGDVEFGRGVAALVVADVVAVDPDEVAAGDAFEPEQLAAPRPVLREFELLAVGPGGVDVVGHLRWAVGRDLGGDVAVDGPVVALLLPHPGHVHGVPLPAAPLPAGREVRVMVGVLELPPAVQRQRPRGGFVGRGEEVLAGAAQGLFGVGVGAQEGVRRLLAFPGALRVFQVGLDLGGIAGTVDRLGVGCREQQPGGDRQGGEQDGRVHSPPHDPSAAALCVFLFKNVCCCWDFFGCVHPGGCRRAGNTPAGVAQRPTAHRGQSGSRPISSAGSAPVTGRLTTSSATRSAEVPPEPLRTSRRLRLGGSSVEPGTGRAARALSGRGSPGSRSRAMPPSG